jgi:hypothetical protein
MDCSIYIRDVCKDTERKEVRHLEIKDLSFEEKYNKLYDQYVLTDVTVMTFVKEMGLTEQYMEYSMKVMRKMLPSLLGSAFKFIQILAPGRAFKMTVEGIVKDSLITEPLSNMEIVSLSDREAEITTTNSVQLKKYRDIIKKTGLRLDLTEYWKLMNESVKGMAKEFGADMTIDTSQIEEDTITYIIKLSK